MTQPLTFIESML